MNAPRARTVGPRPVAVVAWSLYLPGVDVPAVLPEFAAASPDRAAEPAYPPELARELLGRKGLLNKDPATRLALCAVHRALGRRPGSPRDDAPADPRVAVIASSNLGNVAAVVEVVRAVRAGGRREVSPLTAPNASSNALASAVAIWFRLGGPNIMICSGATAGLDALAAGTLLLRSGRADRVVVVGAEPVDDVVASLYDHPARPGSRPSAGAACVVLEPASARPAPVLGAVRAAAEPPLAVPDPDVLVLGPARPTDAIDLTARCGYLYGALGVAQAAVAAAIVGAFARPVRIVCGDPIDGWRITELRAPTLRPSPVPASPSARADAGPLSVW